MLLGFGNVQIRNEITLTKTGEEIGKQSDSFSVSIVDPLPPFLVSNVMPKIEISNKNSK